MSSLLVFLCLACAIDGDTLQRDGANVRLWGIDAPEIGHKGGRASKAHLHGLTAGKRIRCERRDRDRYGRIVARCFVGDTDLACAMVRARHARDWPRYSNGFYRRCR